MATDGSMKHGAISAATKVLGVVELLENILIHLPCKEVLLDQRVCRIWKATIANSVKMQQALGFTATESSVKTKWEELTSDCADFLPPADISAHDFLAKSKSDTYITLNPLLRLFLANEFQGDTQSAGVPYGLAYNTWMSPPATGSHKAMSLFQPPIRNLEIRVMQNQVLYTEDIKKRSAITIGDLVDCLDGVKSNEGMDFIPTTICCMREIFDG